MKRIIEPFAGFDTGRPHLELRINPKWSSVTWGDGSVLEYPAFARLIDEASNMNDELRRLFNENREALSSGSELLTGGVHGGFYACPTPLAGERCSG